MEEEAKSIPAGTELTSSEPVLKKGEVQMFNKKAWNASPPYWIMILVRTYYFSASGISALIGASDLFTGKQAKVLMLVMGIFGLLLGGFAKATGVVPNGNHE